MFKGSIVAIVTPFSAAGGSASGGKDGKPGEFLSASDLGMEKTKKTMMIKGIKYNVIAEAEASVMAKKLLHQKRFFSLQRPNGSKIFTAIEYDNGYICKAR